MPTMPNPNPNPHPGPRPYPVLRPQYVIVQQRACRPVYDNQYAIDALNGLLSNCDKLKLVGLNTCNSTFKSLVQTELTNQLNKAVYIGNDCNTISPSTIYRTY